MARTTAPPPSPRREEGAVNPLGPVTPVSAELAAAERFRQEQSPLPTALFARPRPPAPRAKESGRYRRRGLLLLESGRLVAAIGAFRQAILRDPADAAAHHALGQALLREGRLTDAVDSLQLSVVLAEGDAAYLDLGAALRRLRREPEAIAAYRRALDLAPELTEAAVALAELLDIAGEEEEAAASFRRAAAGAPDSADAELSLARAAMLEGDFRDAESRLRRAIAIEPKNDVLHKFLGDALARLGRFPDAIGSFDRALGLNPLQVEAHFAAVEAMRCGERERPRLTRMRAALDQTVLDADAQVTLHFAIGKLLDDLGEYPEAMRHFEAGNRIRGRFDKFDEAAFAADIDRLRRRFTPEFFAANTVFGCDDETPVLIVGLPRSGTTLVEQILSCHPQIAAGGELGFWIRRATAWGIAEATDLSPAAAQELSRQYLTLLRRSGPSATRVTDKLPFNLLCLGVIHLLLPKARIILCQRHPVDTCLSMYFTRFKQTISFVADKADLAAAYRQYARLMEHWRAVLPPDRLLVVEYEALIHDREATTRRMIRFCGLDWDAACLRPERNQRVVTTASLWQARQPVYTSSIGRWRHYEPWLGDLRQLLDLPGEAGLSENFTAFSENKP